MGQPVAISTTALGTVSPSARAFQPTTDPRQLWRSGQYAEVLTRLRAAIEHDGGLLLLLGDVGTGKSILCNSLGESLADEGVRLGNVAYPGLELLDFHAVVAEAFGLPSELSTSEDFVEQFARFLGASRARTERVLLVVDDAQHLRPELIVGIERLLEADARAALDKDGVLSILLVGDNSLAAVLRKGEHLGLTSRIKVRCELGRLSLDEVAAYIRHRLTMAGIDADCFTTDASREVALLSEGIPRLIDGVCVRALASARVGDVPVVVDAVLVKECAETVDGPTDVDVSVPPPRWVDGVAAPRWSIGARHLRSAAVAIIVGLVGIGVGLTAGYWYRSQGDARHRPVPVPTATTSGSEADVAAAPALSSTTGPPSVSEAIRPPNLDAEPVRPVPRVEQRRTRASPSGASAAVRGAPQRGRPGTPSAPPRMTTDEPSGTLPPTDSAASVTPSVPREEPPRSAAARGAEEPDPGAVIDWLVRQPRRHTD